MDLGWINDFDDWGRIDEGALMRGFSRALSLADWVEAHRVILEGPLPGPWRNENCPWAREPMEAFSDRRIRRLTVISGTQMMKTEMAVNISIYSLAMGRDVLFYEPDIFFLKKVIGNRIRPALMALDESVHVALDSGTDPGRKRKDSVMELRLPGGGTLVGLTPSMASGKAAHSAPVIVLDEIEKMQSPDILLVADSRSTAYGEDAIIVAVSTPGDDATGSIYRDWQAGSRGAKRNYGAVPAKIPLAKLPGWPASARCPISRAGTVAYWA